MAEDLSIITGSKQEQYQSLLPQIKGLLEGEPDLIANMANTVAALKEQFGWLWVGFYVVKKSFEAKRGRTGIGTFPGTCGLYPYKKG